jgi:hypothetical protein
MIRISFLFSLLLLFSCQSDPSGTTKPAPVPAAPDDALFERLPGSKTGIEFANNITEDHQINIITNSYMYNGGGVGILDVNNDGLPDIYLVSSQESNRLYLNQGNFTFVDITEQAGVSAAEGFKTGVTIVDINADGRDDIYVCRTGLRPSPDRDNLLFINTGNNTFREAAAEYGLNSRAASNHANFFDYDLDGDLDMYLLNHPVDFKTVNKVRLKEEGGKRVRVATPKTPLESDRLFRNEGNGTFKDVSLAAGIVNRAFGLSATVSDFNQDGYPDIFIGNDYIEPDQLFINNRNGTFTNRIDDYFRHTSNHTMGVDIADFNNDGLMDLVGLDMIAEDNRRQKLLMSTMILERYKTLVQYGYGHQMMRNVLQVNNGDGTFSEIGTLAGISNTDWSWSPLMTDFDNDGYKDLYVTNGYRRDVTNLDYLTYTVDSLNRTGGITTKRFQDFNEFLAMIPSEKLQNYMFRNTGDYQFEKVSNQWGLVEPSFSNGSAYADLDADGDLDLVVNNIDMEAFVYRNRAREQNKGNYLQIALEGSASNTDGIGARVEITTPSGLQVKEATPVRGFFSSSHQLLHFGVGQASQIERIIVRWPDGKESSLEGQPVNQVITISYGDAEPPRNSPSPETKLFVQEDPGKMGLDYRHSENDFEDFNRERLLPHRLSRLGPAVAVADINGDGTEDLFLGGAAGQEAKLFTASANGRFQIISQGTFNAAKGQEDVAATFLDAEGDGDMDLYVVSGGNAFPLNDPGYQDRLYLNDGQGGFSLATNALPNMRSSGGAVLAQDLDFDGDTDLLVGGRTAPGNYPMAPKHFILRNDGGTFSIANSELMPSLESLGMISTIQAGDVDGDQQPEIIMTGEWMPVYIWGFEPGNDTWMLKSTPVLDKAHGWWNHIELADVDGDGDLDLLGGNLGTNTRIRATEDAPLRLYARDFDANGSIDPLITYYNEGKEYPLARRESILKQLAGLKRQFVYFEPFAEATIEDLFPRKELNKADQYTAYEFRTCLFRNDGTGQFVKEPLPLPAQWSPIFDIHATDVNKDGLTDLVLVGNNYSSDVESGRYDAGNGCLLLGQEDGSWKALSPGESGFSAHLEARHLVPVTSQKYLVVNNNDDLQIFKVQSGKVQ